MAAQVLTAAAVPSDSTGVVPATDQAWSTYVVLAAMLAVAVLAIATSLLHPALSAAYEAIQSVGA